MYNTIYSSDFHADADGALDTVESPNWQDLTVAGSLRPANVVGHKVRSLERTFPISRLARSGELAIAPLAGV